MRVSVVIPALNEEATVAGVVAAVLEDAPHEVIVVDADSHDATAAEAARAGARVLGWREILPEIAPRPGKGESLWRGVAAASGDVVVFIDADLDVVDPGTVRALAEPFGDDGVHLVKADYPRTIHGAATGGGRVTELTAKPLLRLCFPELAGVRQPLAGEYAIRRSTAWELAFVDGYGVEAGLLIDVARRFGPDAVAQVSLGPRRHRNRPLTELAPMADVVAATILGRAGLSGTTVSERPPLSGILGTCSPGSC